MSPSRARIRPPRAGCSAGLRPLTFLLASPRNLSGLSPTAAVRLSQQKLSNASEPPRTRGLERSLGRPDRSSSQRSIRSADKRPRRSVLVLGGGQNACPLPGRREAGRHGWHVADGGHPGERGDRSSAAGRRRRHAARAGLDEPLPISHCQPTTQPSLVVEMIDALRLSGEEIVLEVGTGYGYQTALLARLAGLVYSVEHYADLAEHARANLSAVGVRNAQVVVGDGTAGLPDRVPSTRSSCPQLPECPARWPSSSLKAAGWSCRSPRQWLT